VNPANRQQFTFLYAFLTTMVMAIMSLVMGLFPV
jgi:hypothetical protein